MHRCSIFANFLLSMKTNINLGWWQVLRLAVDTLTWNAGFSFWVGSSIGRSVLVSWLPPPVQSFTHPMSTGLLCFRSSERLLQNQNFRTRVMFILRKWGVWVRLQPMHCCVLPLMTKCVHCYSTVKPCFASFSVTSSDACLHYLYTKIRKQKIVQSCLVNSQKFTISTAKNTDDSKL